MPIIFLSKKEFIEHTLNDIPKCVIFEILNSYFEPIPENLSIPSYISRINILSKTMIISPYTDQDLKILTRFINETNSTWPEDKLFLAFDFFERCKDQNFRTYLPISSSTKIGLPTPDHPFSLSACVLFSMCKDIGCTILSNFTIFDLYLSYYQEWNLKKCIDNRILYSLDEENIIRDIRLKYQIDLYGVSNLESQFIVDNSINDLNFLYRLSDPNISPYLYENFNPLLPDFVYSKNSLELLLKKEGIQYKNFESSLHRLRSLRSDNFPLQESLIQQLKWISSIPTFIHGKQTAILQQETFCTLENVNELSFDECICYGKQGEIFSLYTYRELEDVFNKMRRFCIVNENKLSDLNQIQILKLRKICKDNNKVQLLKIIDCIQSFQDFESEKCQKILEIIKLPENRIMTELCFQRLHELSMYMRGWKDGEKLPISEGNDDPQCDIELEVTNGFIRFYEQIEKSGLCGQNILKLPLMRYENKMWRMATLKEEGLTIEDRCIIIRMSNDMNSCIRISSNWLASTTWYYMYMIGIPVLYLIEDLKTLT